MKSIVSLTLLTSLQYFRVAPKPKAILFSSTRRFLILKRKHPAAAFHTWHTWGGGVQRFTSDHLKGAATLTQPMTFDFSANRSRHPPNIYSVIGTAASRLFSPRPLTHCTYLLARTQISFWHKGVTDCIFGSAERGQSGSVTGSWRILRNLRRVTHPHTHIWGAINGGRLENFTHCHKRWWAASDSIQCGSWWVANEHSCSFNMLRLRTHVSFNWCDRCCFQLLMITGTLTIKSRRKSAWMLIEEVSVGTSQLAERRRRSFLSEIND